MLKRERERGREEERKREILMPKHNNEDKYQIKLKLMRG